MLKTAKDVHQLVERTVHYLEMTTPGIGVERHGEQIWVSMPHESGNPRVLRVELVGQPGERARIVTRRDGAPPVVQVSNHRYNRGRTGQALAAALIEIQGTARRSVRGNPSGRKASTPEKDSQQPRLGKPLESGADIAHLIEQAERLAKKIESAETSDTSSAGQAGPSERNEPPKPSSEVRSSDGKNDPRQAPSDEPAKSGADVIYLAERLVEKIKSVKTDTNSSTGLPERGESGPRNKEVRSSDVRLLHEVLQATEDTSSSSASAKRPAGFRPDKLLPAMKRLTDGPTRGRRKAEKVLREQMRVLLGSLGLASAEASLTEKDRIGAHTNYGQERDSPGSYHLLKGRIDIDKDKLGQAHALLQYLYGGGKRPADFQESVRSLIVLVHETLHGYGKSPWSLLGGRLTSRVDFLVNELVTDVTMRWATAELFGPAVAKEVAHGAQLAQADYGYHESIKRTIGAIHRVTNWSSEDSALALEKASIDVKKRIGKGWIPHSLTRDFVRAIPGLDKSQRKQIVDFLLTEASPYRQAEELKEAA